MNPSRPFRNFLGRPLRSLLRDRGFTFTVVATLALVIGVNAAILSAVYGVLLKPLPFDEADRLVTVFNSYPKAGAERSGATAPDYFDRRADVAALAEVALYRSPNRSLDLGTADTGPRVRQVSTFSVTPSFFPLLRVSPARGRVFTEEEGEEGAEDTLILSHGLWQRLGGGEEVLGSDLRLDGRPFRVVGIMEPDFRYLDPEVELWTPIVLTEEDKQRHHSNQWTMLARLADGASLETAQAQVDAVNARNLERNPQFREALINAGFASYVEPLHESVVRDVRPSLLLLWGGGLFVLLIGAINLANLFLVRALGRRRETATRIALGAGGRSLLGLALSESLILAGVATAAGLGLGQLGLLALRQLGLEHLPRGHEVALETPVVAAVTAVALLLAFLLALFPAFQGLSRRLSTALREGGRTGTGGRASLRLRRGLVVAQVAVAFVLLAASALLLVSFRQVLAIDPGFKPQGRLTARVYPPPSRYETEKDLARYIEDAVARLGALPGVRAAAATDSLPFGGSYNDSVMFAEGYVPEPGESVISPASVNVSAGYFETMGVPLLDGRTFDARDTAEAPPVIVISEKLAKKFWPGRSAVGGRMFFPSDSAELGKPGPDTVMITVIGVVGEAKTRNLVTDADSVGAYYMASTQTTRRSLAFLLDTELDPASLAPTVERALHELDPEVPVFSVRTLESLMAESLTTRQATLLLALTFGIVALALAALGLYGVLAFQVRQRRREIGIRMAVGSNRRRIVTLVLKEGFALVLLGAVLGLAGAFGLRSTLAAQLYQVAPLDPRVLALTAALLAGVALLACYVPARRASRVHPATVLLNE